MRIPLLGILALLPFTSILARPLSFEQRTPGLFRARLGDHAVTISPDRVTIGDVTLRFPGSSPQPRLEGVGPGAPSTYIGPGMNRTFLQFPKLAIRNLYPGIDAILYGNGEKLEYDLVLAPGASPARVRLSFHGSRRLRIDARGNLMVETPAGVLQQTLPRVFQSGGRQVSARYVLLSRNQAGFRIGPHDARLPLTVDPALVYTRYFGGSGSDSANAVATDAQGNVYVAGQSNSVDFPTTGGLAPKVSPPLVALSNGGQTVTPLPVAGENSITAVGGTHDGRILYVVAAGATYLSSDGGASWVQNPALVTPPLTSNSLVIGNIAVDEIDPSKAYIATSRGLFFTGTAGQNWGVHDLGLAANQDGSVYASSVIVSPIDHLICYATTGRPNYLFKSTDAGNTWQQLHPAYPGEPSAPFVFSNIIAALGPNGSDLYVIDDSGTLLKSTDGGASWQKLGQQLFSSTALVIDSVNPSNIYVLDNFGVQKSGDGGLTFTTIVPTVIPATPQSLLVRTIALDSVSGALYVGTQNQIYVTSDGGVTLKVVSQVSTTNLQTLVSLGGRVFAGLDTPSTPFLLKLDPSGSQILYSTFIGGGKNDSISALKVDAQGNVVIAGSTFLQGFPVTSMLSNPSPPGSPSGFVAKLSADGTRLVYSAALGGAKGVSLQGLALDTADAAYITGQTQSLDFPTSPNALQPQRPAAACTRPQTDFFTNPNLGTSAFASKLSPDGSALVYSTFLTGTCGSVGQGIAVDPAGQAIVTGYTTSPDFPVTPNTYQPAFPGDPNQTATGNAFTVGFVTVLGSAGDKLIASSYLGGGFSTQASAVALDSSGNTYVTGFTQGIAPGATPGAFRAKAGDTCVQAFGIGPSPPYRGTGDAFILKLAPGLGTARYLTYLGGGCNDSANSIAVDASGNAWVAGLTQSPDFPLRTPFEIPGGQFLSELSADGSQLLFSSGADGVNVALDAAGAAYVAGRGVAPAIPKRVQSFGGFGASAVLNRIDPGVTPPVIVDSIDVVTGFPPSAELPFSFRIAPGQLIRITGRNLGPTKQANAQLDSSGRLPFAIGTTSVRFDSVPAPLLSVEDGMIVGFAPFEIDQTTTVTVEFNGQRSNAVRVSVFSSNPQILSVINQDGTLNSVDRPAKAGSVIVLYVAGLGLTKPLSLDGLVNSPPLPVPVAQVSMFFPAAVQPQFVGAAPGLIAGITQVNVQIPKVNPSNVVGITVGNAQAPVYVTP